MSGFLLSPQAAASRIVLVSAAVEYSEVTSHNSQLAVEFIRGSW